MAGSVLCLGWFPFVPYIQLSPLSRRFLISSFPPLSLSIFCLWSQFKNVTRCMLVRWDKRRTLAGEIPATLEIRARAIAGLWIATRLRRVREAFIMLAVSFDPSLRRFSAWFLSTTSLVPFTYRPCAESLYNSYRRAKTRNCKLSYSILNCSFEVCASSFRTARVPGSSRFVFTGFKVPRHQDYNRRRNQYLIPHNSHQ